LNSVDESSKIHVAIRGMTKADLSEVVAIEERIFSDPWPRSVFVEQISGEGWSAIVAEADDKIIGYACYYIIDCKSHLTNIAVAPAYRRKSVAKRLLESILQIVRENESEYLLLEVRPSNVTARAFYERCGFSLLYRRPKYYRQPVEDALVMVRRLGQGKECHS